MVSAFLNFMERTLRSAFLRTNFFFLQIHYVHIVRILRHKRLRFSTWFKVSFAHFNFFSTSTLSFVSSYRIVVFSMAAKKKLRIAKNLWLNNNFVTFSISRNTWILVIVFKHVRTRIFSSHFYEFTWRFEWYEFYSRGIFISLAATKGEAHFRAHTEKMCTIFNVHCVGIWKIWIAKKSQNSNSCRKIYKCHGRKIPQQSIFCTIMAVVAWFHSLACDCYLLAKSNWMKNEASDRAADVGEESERSLNHNHNQIIDRRRSIEEAKKIYHNRVPSSPIQCEWARNQNLHSIIINVKWQQPQRLWLYRWHNNNANNLSYAYKHHQINSNNDDSRERKRISNSNVWCTHTTTAYSSIFLLTFWFDRRARNTCAMKTNKKISKLKKYKRTHAT